MRNTPVHSVSVAGVVVRDDGRILVVQRRDNNNWEPPGGVLELAETFEVGVKREILEETGVIVEVDALTGAYKNVTQGVVALVFRCHPIAGSPIATAESTSVEWFTESQVRDRMATVYRVRVDDALSTRVAARAHDGAKLLTE